MAPSTSQKHHRPWCERSFFTVKSQWSLNRRLRSGSNFKPAVSIQGRGRTSLRQAGLRRNRSARCIPSQGALGERPVSAHCAERTTHCVLCASSRFHRETSGITIFTVKTNAIAGRALGIPYKYCYVLCIAIVRNEELVAVRKWQESTLGTSPSTSHSVKRDHREIGYRLAEVALSRTPRMNTGNFEKEAGGFVPRVGKH
ncbi:hypothetical protein ACUXAV_004859 [Cupriavidus metallidurans]|jgi:hypothetical protein